MKINLHCLSFLSFIQKFSKFQPIIEVKQLKVGRKISLWNKCFHYFMLATILAPNYCNVLFPAQQLWVFSYNAWRVWRTPDKRSETIFFIQNLSRSFRFTAPWRCFFLFSSPHSSSTGFRSEDRDSHGKRFILCSVTHFCVYFDVCFGLLSWWKIQTRPIIRFLTEAVRFDFLSVGIW